MKRITLDDFKVIEKIPVQWGDMDAANHVNNLIYLKWAESARIHYFEKMNMDVSFQKGSIGPILGWQECKYIFPMTYPDTAIVATRTIKILEDRFFLECAVFSEKHERMAILSQQSIVPYDYTQLKKAPIPDSWLAGIKALEE